MPNISRLNELIRAELAQIVNQEVLIEGALITLAYVECSEDLRQAKVGFSVLPDRLAGTALRKLTAATGQLMAIMRRRVKLRRLPRLVWEFDATEREADKIEKLIAEIDINK